jgi:hypothetical protein
MVMSNKSFVEKDKQSVIEFLNFVAKYAQFNNMSVQNNIEFYKLLQFMQTILLPKIDNNIFEFKKIHEDKKTEE